jgi:hypothetical protein
LSQRGESTAILTRLRAILPAGLDQPINPKMGSGARPGNLRAAEGMLSDFFLPLRGFVTKTQNNIHKQKSYKRGPTLMFFVCCVALL